MGIEKPKKKGLWSPEEDEKLRDYVVKNGHACWTSLPKGAGLHRNGKSCRLRWINYLRPGLKRGAFSVAEKDTILSLHQILGNKWSQIAQHLPGRSDNEIKNYWHSCLKKRVPKMEASESLQHSKGSVLDTHQIGVGPKVLFAEWLSFDHFYNHGLDNNFQNHYISNHADALLQNPKCTQVYVHDILHSPPHLDYQLGYFPGELCINYDEFNSE